MTITLHRASKSLALVALSLLLMGVATTAPAAPGDDGEQARINSERSAANAGFSARVAECERRFVITSCVEDAKRDRRHALDALKARQLQLDEARRRARTSERRAELAAKAAEDAKREQERAAHSAASAPEAATRESVGHSFEPRRPEAASAVARAASPARQDRPGRGLGVEPANDATPEQRRASEERHRASFVERQREAAEHRAEVLDKAAKRSQGRPAALPLQVPSAASGASASTR